MSRMIAIAALLIPCLLAPTPVRAAEDLLGENGILFWTPERQVAGYRAIDTLYATREVRAGPLPYPLLPDPADWSDFRYRFDGTRRTLDDYMREMRVAGLIAVKDGRVRLERYGLGNDEQSRWISFSVAKSVTSMLIGAAIQDGHIESVDDAVTDYLPRLKGSAYEGVTIRNLLQMASGVRWNEDYADPASDVANAPGGTAALQRYMASLPREAEPGTRFHYNTGETNVAGALLRAAIGNNLATYLEHRIWRPFGMEHDASWMLDGPGGVELGGCCINATLRDYARIGLFALGDGVLPDRRRVLPAGWMRDSTTASPASDGYGYYWWLGDDGVYRALGVFGQIIRIDPAERTVIVLHSAWPVAGGPELWAHREAFLDALTGAL